MKREPSSLPDTLWTMFFVVLLGLIGAGIGWWLKK